MGSTKKRKPARRKPRRAWRALLVVLIGCILLCAILSVLLRFASYGSGFDNSVYHEDAFAGQKVLFLVPHEDDDLAMSGSVIRLYVNGGADVTVAFATNGDNTAHASTRISEAIAGLKTLGVLERNIIFLGYGDNWKLTPYSHIYHAPGQAVVTSEAGHTKTYGTASHPDFHTGIYGEPADYTRDNYKEDIRTLLRIQQPDVIFCVDLDSHPDHCVVSFLFEEALCELIKSDQSFRPKVYKGYSYTTSWYGQSDFYGDYLESTLPPDSAIVNDPRFPLDTPSFNWEERVRFPVPREALSYTLRSNLIYRALSKHVSQDARYRARNILNADQIFFERRTDSLLYNNEVTLSASSGDPSHLNDFKLADTSNIYDYPMVFDRCTWQPDAADAQKTITVNFPARVTVCSVSLYDYYQPDSNITAGTLRFSDGSALPVGALRVNGEETRVEFTPRSVSSFTFTIDAYTGDTPGLMELAAYGPREGSAAPAFIKLALNNQQQSFLYRYYANPGETVSLCVYAYPGSGADAVITLLSEDSAVTLNDGVLQIAPYAKPGRHVVRAEWAHNPEVYDEIEIIIPNALERPYHSMLALYERLLDRVEWKLKEILG